jgi:hypothetical protein
VIKMDILTHLSSYRLRDLNSVLQALDVTMCGSLHSRIGEYSTFSTRLCSIGRVSITTGRGHSNPLWITDPGNNNHTVIWRMEGVG